VSNQSSRRLVVEGWRFIAHSYALVNQWQLLALLRRSDIAVSVVDAPFYRRHWQPQKGLFSAEEEHALESIEVAGPDVRAGATLRISAPFDFSPSRSDRTLVFGTSETQVLREEQFLHAKMFERLQKAGPPRDIRIVTPSHWSAEAYYQAGFGQEEVYVVPHGVDVGTFRPLPEIRNEVRKRLALPDDAFVFLSVGSMTGNKGIDLLLHSFSQVSRKFPNVRLVLKGLDTLYQSEMYLSKNMQTLSSDERECIRGRITYLGGSLSNAQMTKLYQAADSYVSPYRAEGFNIPVLEAAACGVPVICTRGGSTDDFVTDEFAKKLDSQKTRVDFMGQKVSRLEPDLQHLTALMGSVIEDRSWRERAAQAGPRHVQTNYTWDHVAARLVERLFD
jgi:glycosyltransferase involved in cell wall biosynthesis